METPKPEEPKATTPPAPQAPATVAPKTDSKESKKSDSKSDTKKPEEKKSEAKKSEPKKSEHKKSDSKKSEHKKSDSKKSDSKKAESKKSDSKVKPKHKNTSKEHLVSSTSSATSDLSDASSCESKETPWQKIKQTVFICCGSVEKDETDDEEDETPGATPKDSVQSHQSANAKSGPNPSVIVHKSSQNEASPTADGKAPAAKPDAPAPAAPPPASTPVPTPGNKAQLSSAQPSTTIFIHPELPQLHVQEKEDPVNRKPGRKYKFTLKANRNAYQRFETPNEKIEEEKEENHSDIKSDTVRKLLLPISRTIHRSRLYLDRVTVNNLYDVQVDEDDDTFDQRDVIEEARSVTNAYGSYMAARTDSADLDYPSDTESYGSPTEEFLSAVPSLESDTDSLEVNPANSESNISDFVNDNVQNDNVGWLLELQSDLDLTWYAGQSGGRSATDKGHLVPMIRKSCPQKLKKTSEHSPKKARSDSKTHSTQVSPPDNERGAMQRTGRSLEPALSLEGSLPYRVQLFLRTQNMMMPFFPRLPPPPQQSFFNQLNNQFRRQSVPVPPPMPMVPLYSFRSHEDLVHPGAFEQAYPIRRPYSYYDVVGNGRRV